jgi:anthranilate 1,2-dioxygenase ferredoxin component
MWHTIVKNRVEIDTKVSESKPITLVLNGIRICLGKNQGVFYAIEDTCPHQDASLGKGKTHPTGGVECPFHHYIFDLKTGKCLVGACRDLKTFPVKIENEAVLVFVESEII